MICGIVPRISPELKLFKVNNPLKLFLCLIIFLVCSRETFAQSPHKINYQAIARNTASGAELSNQQVYVVVKILAGDPNGEIVYQEDHQTIHTNLYGLFSLQIGNGTPVSGNFFDLDWENNSYWLEIDLDAGQGLKTLGTMEFVSVPYALHARTATYIDDADADPTNELVKDFLFDKDARELTIVQEGDNKTVSIGSIDDADPDPTNELVKDFLFDENSRQLTIVQEGENKTVDIGTIDDADSDPNNEIIENWNFSNGILTFQEAGNDYSLDLNTLSIDDADADPTNELVNDFLFNENTRELTIVQEGDNKTVGIGSVDDADSDPNNERIDAGYPQLNGRQLDISEGGIMYSVDLSSLLSWDKSENAIYSVSKRVGIGTDSPNSQLTVRKTASGPGEILRVENALSVAALSVKDHKVGLAGETGANHVHLHGSVGYSTRVLDSGANYTLQPDDYFIACRLLSNNDVNIYMPDPTTCPGRVIYITRKNKTSASNPKVYVNWEGYALNFSAGNTILQDFVLGLSLNRIAVISLGQDGWATMD